MLSKFSVKRPFTVLVGVIIVIVIGIVAMMRMTLDLLPNMTFPYVMVITTDMGASPEDVESNVTAPIEASLATTSNLKNIQSMSYNSYSTVVLEYEQSANMDAVMIEIQQKLDQLEGKLPDAAAAPIIMQVNPNMLPVMVAAVNVEGKTQSEITDYVTTTIQPQLESIEGVASVQTSGGIEEKVQVTLNQKKIDKLNDKIEKAIDDQFVEKATALDATKEQVASGKGQVESGKQQLANQVSQAQTQIDTQKVQLYTSASDLANKKEELTTAAGVLDQAISGLQQAYDGAKATVDPLQQQMDSLNSVLTLVTSNTITPEQFKEQTGMSVEEAQAAVAQLQAGIEQVNAEIVKQLAPLATPLASYNITINSYEDLPNAIAQLTAARAQISTGLQTIEATQAQLEAGKAQLDQAQTALNKTQILTSLQLADASSQIISGESQITMAEQQIDSAKEQAKASADLNKVLSLNVVSNLLVAQNLEMPAGYVNGGDYLVKVGEDVTDPNAVKDIILLDLNMEGIDPIKLSDVADVEIVDNSSEVYARVNGQPGILLSFNKQTGFATGDVSDNIQKKFKTITNTEELKPSFAILMDQGVYIDMIVKSIIQNILLGAALAILVLIIFLRDIRPTIIISCAIPLSILFAVVLMYFCNITLNIISMSGLTLGIGMLVDNSIVVIENIYRLKSQGMSIGKACVKGAGEVAGAITASTLTTICVFLPIVFTEGITRQMFVDMGLTITFTLLASLLVALTLVPAMAKGLLRKSNMKTESSMNRFLRFYGRSLRKILKVKWLVFIIMIAMLVLSITLAVSRGVQFMPEMTSTQATVTLSVPDEEKRTLEQMEGYANTLTERLQGVKDIETIGAMQGGGNAMMSMMGNRGGNNITMYLIIDKNSKMSNDDIEKMIEEKSADLDCKVKINTAMMDMSQLTGDGISVKIEGRDLDKLQDLAKQVASKLEEVEGTVDIDNGLKNTTAELVITVNKEKAAKYGLTVAQVFQSVAGKISSSSSATTIKNDVKDYDVMVQTDEQSDMTVDELKKMTLKYTDTLTQETKEVKLSEIAEFKTVEELNQINRDSQTRFISVKAAVDENHNVGLVADDVKEKLKEIEVPEGYTIKMAGEDEAIQDAMSQVMLMMVLAVLLIYLIMVAQFQSLLSPFIIMFTIPLAFTGGFLGLYLSGNIVSVIALVGFVMLSGIIVNNGIVLVDYINQKRREGMSKKDAIIESATTRLRPVLMTALTTVISMSTMAIGMGRGTEMAQPMALVVVGGMIYGTLLTLIVVPCLYDAFNREKDMREEDLDSDEAVVTEELANVAPAAEAANASETVQG